MYVKKEKGKKTGENLSLEVNKTEHSTAVVQHSSDLIMNIRLYGAFKM